MTSSVRLLVLAGPTACGKTRLGVDVAHATRTEIVSADSRQVYRGLDIGSGKDLDEYRRVDPPVPYHLIDVVGPETVYSVFHYQRDCYALLQRLSQRSPFSDGRPLLMVGGTGLYIESVLRGYRIPNVPENVAWRDRAMQEPHDELVRRLDRMDPALLATTDVTSKKRVVRALEIARQALHGPVRYSDPPPLTIEAAVFCVEQDSETLAGRIEKRLSRRMTEGLVAEVRGLLDSGLSRARMAQLGLEYGEVASHLAGEKSEAQMMEDLARGIRRLAKRQRTWFRGLARRGTDVRWIDATDRDAILSHPWCRAHAERIRSERID